MRFGKSKFISYICCYKYVFLNLTKSFKMYQEPTSPMKFRVVEKQFENKSEFHPEWFCDNVNACNHGWNSVHDSRLMTLPTKTHEDSLKRIEWFSNCFQKPILEVTHGVV